VRTPYTQLPLPYFMYYPESADFSGGGGVKQNVEEEGADSILDPRRAPIKTAQLHEERERIEWNHSLHKVATSWGKVKGARGRGGTQSNSILNQL